MTSRQVRSAHLMFLRLHADQNVDDSFLRGRLDELSSAEWHITTKADCASLLLARLPKHVVSSKPSAFFTHM